MATRRSNAFRIYLYQVGPIHDPDFMRAPESLKRELLRQVVKIGLEEKDKDLAAGLDRAGNPMRPIKESTRKNRHSATGHADPNAPPLTPAYGLSRTRSLLSGRAMKDHAEFFWRYDEHTQAPWAKILDYHRTGAGHLPVRDVIGASAAMIERVRIRTLALWARFKRGGTLIIDNPAIAEKQVVGLPRYTFQNLPDYVPKNPANAIPKNDQQIDLFQIDGRVYTMGGTFGGSGKSAASVIKRAVEEGTFRGFKRYAATVERKYGR